MGHGGRGEIGGRSTLELWPKALGLKEKSFRPPQHLPEAEAKKMKGCGKWVDEQDVMSCLETNVREQPMVSMWLVSSRRDRDEGSFRVRPSAECSIPVLHWAHVAVHHSHGIPVGAELSPCPHVSSDPATTSWLFDF